MKPLKIIRSAEALADLADIHLLVAVDNPAAADRFLDAVRRSLQILSRWPEIGPRYKSNRSELAGMRFWPVRGYSNYLVFYRVSARPAGLHVVRVLHGARDIPQELE